MRRLTVLLLVLASFRPLVAETPPAAAEAAPTADTLQQDFAAISALYPRLEGSENERRLLALIRSRLDEAGIAWTTFDFRSSEAGFQTPLSSPAYGGRWPEVSHSFSSCLRAMVPGEVQDTLIVAVPLNHPADALAGEDGSAGVALALEMLRGARAAKPRLTLLVLFLGAEFGEGPEYPMGSALFLRDFQPAARVAVVYLDLRSSLSGDSASPRSGVILRMGGRGTVSPPWLVDWTFRVLSGQGVPVDLRQGQLQVYRLALSDRVTLVDPWLAAGLPAIGIEAARQSAPGDERNSGITLAPLAASLESLLTFGAAGIPGQWDRHYLLLAAGDRLLVVGELVWVVIFAGSLGLALGYSLLHVAGLKKYLRSLGRHVLTLVPVLVVAWGLLAGSTLLLEALVAERRFPTLWTWQPGLFFLAKLTIAAVPAGSLAWLLRRLPLPRGGNFWSAAALLLLLVDVLVGAATEISLAAPFLWALAFVFAASLARRRLVKLLWFLPSAAWMAMTLAGAISLPSLSLARFLLFSRVWGNLLLAVMALPFLLFLIRLTLLFAGARGRLLLLRLAAALPPFAAAGLVGWVLVWTPFGPQRLRPIQVVQSVDTAAGTNRLELTSPIPLGRIEVSDASGVRQLDLSGDSASIDLAPVQAPIRVAQESTAMLGRRNILLTIAIPPGAISVRAQLEATDDFVLYDSSQPFEREGSRRYRLAIGAYPPDPLPVQITVPEGGAYTLTLELELGAPLLGAEVKAPDAQLTGHVRLATRVPITG